MMHCGQEDDGINAKISKALDKMGLSETDIKRNAAKWSQWESELNNNRASSWAYKMYITGSRAEGLALSSSKSDNDWMVSFETAHVMNNMEHWQQQCTKLQFLTDSSSSSPGYTKIRLLDNNEPVFFAPANMACSRDIFKDFLVMDHTSVVLSRNFCFSPSLWTNQINGPANTTCYGGLFSDIDMVMCLRCPTWPREANEWLTRSRPANWPSAEFIRTTANMGCYLVPKYSLHSYQPDTDWSYSFSLVERNLIQSWSNKLLKCYVLMKMIKNKIVDNGPVVEKRITSYHIKTIMFWLTELHGVYWWEQHSLTESVIFCLNELQARIKEGCCAHYFIRDNNIFENFSGTAQNAVFVRMIENLIHEGLDSLIRCMLLQEDLEQPSSTGSALVGACSNEHNTGEEDFPIQLMSHLFSVESVFNNTDRLFLSQLENLKFFKQLHTSADSYNGDFVALPLVKCHVGSSAFSFLLSKNTIPNTVKYQLNSCARRLLEESTTGDVSTGKLKLANYYYILDDIKLSLHILKNVADSLTPRVISVIVSVQHLFSQYENLSAYQMSALQELVSVSLHLSPEQLQETISSQLLSFPIFFIKTELCCTPKALVFEMFRRIRRSTNLLQSIRSELWNFAVVDPSVLLYFLQFLCYKKIGKQRHMKVALDNLKWAAFEKPDVHYTRDTAANLLGYCYLQLGKSGRATHYFVKSMRLNPLNNVAFIHLAIVLAKTRHRQTVRVAPE